MKVSEIINKIISIKSTIAAIHRIEAGTEDVHTSDVYDDAITFLCEYIEVLNDTEVKR